MAANRDGTEIRACSSLVAVLVVNAGYWTALGRTLGFLLCVVGRRSAHPLDAITETTNNGANQMSETTDRPGEVGLWHRDGHEYWIFRERGYRQWCYHDVGDDGLLGTVGYCNDLPSGGWSKAVPASELAAAKADIRNWSQQLARQGDELVRVRAERETLRSQVSRQNIEIAALKAKLAEVETQLENSLATVMNQGIELASLRPAKEAAEQRADAAEKEVGRLKDQIEKLCW